MWVSPKITIAKMEKKCKECNNNFKTYKKEQIFCSRECSSNSQKFEKKEKICEFSGCTNVFHVINSAKSIDREKRFCSKECQIEWQKFYQLGENNGNYGKENKWGYHDNDKRLEISEKIKKSWQNPERLKKHLDFLDRHRIDDGSFDFQNKLFRDKISSANISRMLSNPSYGAYNSCQRGWYISKKTKDEEYYHSSWEKERMIELDNDKSVIFWTKKHGYVINFIHNNINKRYLPDFLIKFENHQIIEEVKGYIDDENIFKLKCEASLIFFKNIGIEYKINFMYNTKKYEKIINWFNKLKNK
jgi:hypothetical protein